jgi:dUTP pyrophosphatase
MGSALSRPDIELYMKRKPPLVEGLLDPKVQINPNGIDLTLRLVQRIEGQGALGFGNTDRRIPTTSELKWSSGPLSLTPGIYKVTYNEIVHMPMNLVAIARPRSSLLRCGATVETAVWDSGYNGRSESLLVVHNPSGLELLPNARLVQLVFFLNSKPLKKGYSGRYQRENL